MTRESIIKANQIHQLSFAQKTDALRDIKDNNNSNWNSVWTTGKSGSGSSCSSDHEKNEPTALEWFTGIAAAVTGLAAAASPFIVAGMSNKTAQAGTQGNAQANAQETTKGSIDTSNDTLKAMQRAEKSTDLETLNAQISAGTQSANYLESQAVALSEKATAAGAVIESTTAKITKTEAAIESDKTALGDAKTTKSGHEKDLGKLNDSVSGQNSPANLTASMESAIGAVPKTVKQTKADGTVEEVPNPNYDAEVQKIKNEFEPKIEKAKDIKEIQIPAMEEQIKKDEEAITAAEQNLADDKVALETLNDLLNAKKTEKSTAERDREKLVAQQTRLTAQARTLETRRDTIASVATTQTETK